MTIAAVSLDDKYEQESGRVFLTGMQALVRLPMLQRQRDVAAGLNTAGFISGYRGSPIGGYDAALWAAQPFLSRSHITFQPGLNEDLALTAVWGTQQVNLWPGGTYDGVFGIWYGKGPGVDRSGDAIKHLNYDGTAQHGGVLLIAGDDHGAKSSTLPHQSEPAFMAAAVPIFHPAGVQEYLDLGLHGFAMSRYSGCAVGFKAVGETVESSASVSIDPNAVQIAKTIDFDMPGDGLNLRYPDDIMIKESRLLNYKLPAAQAYVRANGLDKIIFDTPKPRLGIVTTGKAYLDVRQAFDELGLTAEMAADMGIRLYKVAMTWPMEPQGALEFAKGLEEIVVIEEKRPIMEDQLRSLLYGRDAAPRIVGKKDENNRVLLPEIGELTPGMVAQSIVGRIKKFSEMPDFDQRLARIEQIETGAKGSPPTILRTPYFCSGCPHNSSTKVPAGSRAMAGIGCHGMSLWMPERNTQTITHMGAEGVNWIGQAPFCKTEHVFQNLGDGTYYHSGLLALRAAVDAGVNITYKILFNDAVAMTGGQPVVNVGDGKLTPDEISRQVHAEGVTKIAVVTDEPDKYPSSTNWAPGVSIHHRDDLDQVQRDLRQTPGCSVLIYDQTCAAEKRRRRKRGLFPDPAKRAFINDLVCEACGDCSVASNCVSVQPKETEWGRKRQIDQSNCNKDFSCVNGFCPSFVTVHGGGLRKAEKAENSGVGHGADIFAKLPMPTLPSAAEPYGILITGIGGTGVVTVSALLGMAAHLDGKGVSALDMAGLAQKNGAVTSHIRIADAPEDLHAVRIATGGSKLILGCDIVVATGESVLSTINEGVTGAVINSHVVPTAQFLADQDMEMAGEGLIKQLQDAVGNDFSHFFNATKLATALMGDSIAANLFLLGAAFQKGYVPLSLEAIEGAIELNGVAVEANKQTFAWGRLAAHDPEAVETITAPLMPQQGAKAEKPSLAQQIARRTDFLTDYQDAAYAGRYLDLVNRAMAAEAEKAPGLEGMGEAVALNFFRLMAYKDEYEVARLYTDGRFMEQVNQQFEGDFSLHMHMAPPLIAKRDPVSGELQKREFGPWMLKLMPLLARMRGLRGGAWDIFGRTEERRMERQLISDYESTMAEVLAGLNHDNHAMATRIAEVPDRMRGFGHVKEKAVAKAKKAEAEMMEYFHTPSERTSAAE
ncbi:MAG: indolepyruvate ferredoxin oxidoreductase family protein [Rhodospirillaceae bacterium]|jgi:indolepyruvate ferredoxin oxidoreductase|nr:indolepyruvate ferredoxin oxidoreductase family protein [Rhodospirillaceae bacterium]MBT3494459.1 indolepyruvate ferredoxin oxidoreductase family protein [Rhodospirillaceae bacterium]MBT3778586.1 indolepyruvate ferredoxin oxidoreductase family protein [Rhodospirillaceae bacterium]MBT3978532.1 indolepyruvate ferredoxin oxidoreductase family protein [Rhodospirillaceae bacterium]MBT4171350.1 indolepyruvate ferredoxin oxidoreductase family protein [Rhodospirillaceae bacterium]